MKVFSTTEISLEKIISEMKITLVEEPTFLLYFHATNFSAKFVAEKLSESFPGVQSLVHRSGKTLTKERASVSLVTMHNIFPERSPARRKYCGSFRKTVPSYLN